jgi:hypothetical protein
LAEVSTCSRLISRIDIVRPKPAIAVRRLTLSCVESLSSCCRRRSSCSLIRASRLRTLAGLTWRILFDHGCSALGHFRSRLKIAGKRSQRLCQPKMSFRQVKLPWVDGGYSQIRRASDTAPNRFNWIGDDGNYRLSAGRRSDQGIGSTRRRCRTTEVH